MLPANLATIGNAAFFKCSGLKQLTLPESLNSIDEWAFSSCTGLTQLTLPEGISSLGRDAFYECTGLTTVNIPRSLSLDDNPFSHCPSLGAFTLTGTGTVLTVINDGKGLVKNGNRLVAYPSASGNYTVPSGITAIGAFAFCGSSISQLTAPSGLTHIYSAAFASCNNLTQVTLPASVIFIGDCAFGSYNIGVFNIFAATPPNVDDFIFFEDEEIQNLQVKVPAASVKTYKDAKGWNHPLVVNKISGF
jgi:hypothetical protein